MLANFSNLITFSRGSNATVTDASGRLTYAPHNLVTNSQDFEAGPWSKNAATVAANTIAAPDGSITADTVTETATTDLHVAFQSVNIAALTTHIFSVYLRANTRNFAMVRVGGGGFTTGPAIKVNLTGSGSTETLEGPVTSSSITPAGNGWFRVSMTFTSTATTNGYTPQFGPHNDGSSISYAGNGTGSVYAWGAQLEAVTYQTTPSPYVSTSVANLLGFSEDFTNAAWTKQRASIVPNAAQNPINGLWTAQKLMEDTTASNSHRVSSALITMPSGILSTVSVYMKAAERTWGYITDAGVTNSGAYVNLATGEFGTIAGGVTRSSIQSVGNGWYRVSISGYLAGTLSQLFVSVATSNGNFSYTGDGNSGIYIYGAQLSNSGSLDPYVPTPGAAPSSTAYYGPRFDYDPVTLAAKGILIEEQRTNLLLRSQEFDNASWTNAAPNTPTVSANSTIAPDGSTTADTLTAATGGGASQSRQALTIAGGTTVTFSVYIKQGSSTSSRILVRDDTNGTNFIQTTAVTWSGGVPSIGGTTGTWATPVNVGNGWWRISGTGTAGAGASISLLVGIFPDNAAGTGSLIVWGAQLEAGAFATSYIPTVASQVTRTADVASITGSLFSQWCRQDEGTFTAEGSTFSTGAPGIMTARSADNAYMLIRRGSGAGTFRIQTPSGVQGDFGTSVSSGKTAAAYRVDDFAAVNNGGTVATDTAGAIPSVTMLEIGTLNNQFFLNGHIRNITYYPTRLTNDQLQAITK